MYEPIIGANESYEGHEPVKTPASTIQRATKLQVEYGGLKADLLQEVNMVDTRIIKPAMEAKDWIQPLKKVIKKREDRKVCSLALSIRAISTNSDPVGFRKISGSGRYIEKKDKKVRARQCLFSKSRDRTRSSERGMPFSLGADSLPRRKTSFSLRW